MDQMTPPGPLEPSFIWVLVSVSLRVIFDLQHAFVFNSPYIVKLQHQQADDLAVFWEHTKSFV